MTVALTRLMRRHQVVEALEVEHPRGGRALHASLGAENHPLG
jgi:hypothetical protein